MGFPGDSAVKTWPAMKDRSQSFEPWFRKIPLEEEMATYSSILARKIPCTEEPGGLQSMESQRVRHIKVTEHAHDERIWSKVSVEQV